MKHAYIITLYTERTSYQMPYIFTNEKEAYLYGEWKFRTSERITSYKVERYFKPDTRFYALD